MKERGRVIGGDLETKRGWGERELERKSREKQRGRGLERGSEFKG